LFIRDPDPVAEIRGGRRITAAEAVAKSGIAGVKCASEFPQAFHRLANDCYFTEIHLVLETNIGQEQTDQNRLFCRTAAEKYPNLAIKNAFPQIALQRTHKFPHEIANIMEAMKITREGILRMMRAARRATCEMDLYAEFMHVIHRHGMVEPAFQPIVSCGKNNFYLHYGTPTGALADGELCLADVGAIVDFCCVDISRVFPRSGRFSELQKSVYQVALQVNDYITDNIKPGMPFFTIDRLCREKSFEGLKALGLLADMGDIEKYVWHGCTHHVGLDVHDVGTYHLPIEENMVFTVDTGIYIREWNIGMRIEDNVLVTAKGLKRLSGDIPRTVREIEEAMA
ncbi:MAG TPA: M24 family metallopeptidase, partial [Clostridia bacterium]